MRSCSNIINIISKLTHVGHPIILNNVSDLVCLRISRQTQHFHPSRLGSLASLIWASVTRAFCEVASQRISFEDERELPFKSLGKRSTILKGRSSLISFFFYRGKDFLNSFFFTHSFSSHISGRSLHGQSSSTTHLFLNTSGHCKKRKNKTKPLVW